MAACDMPLQPLVPVVPENMVCVDALNVECMRAVICFNGLSCSLLAKIGINLLTAIELIYNSVQRWRKFEGRGGAALRALDFLRNIPQVPFVDYRFLKLVSVRSSRNLIFWTMSCIIRTLGCTHQSLMAENDQCCV